MGTDIHVAIQVQEGGAWTSIQWQRAPYENIGEEAVPGFPVAPDGFVARNYDLFGILADVRNGRGFAGSDSGTPWPTIAPDRGLPDDFEAASEPPDPRYQDEGPRYMGDHSFTWVSLDELKAYDWDGTCRIARGVVDAEAYERLEHGVEQPAQYFGWIGGNGVGVYEPEDYQRAKRDGALCRRPYVQAYWTINARLATGDWPGKAIPWLDSLAVGRPLRLVLGFDS